jgi:TRAP-type C4-dicarboxylate transport system substrate-binding protein
VRKLFIVCIFVVFLFNGCKENYENELLSDDTVVLRYAETEKKGTYLSSISDYFAQLVQQESDGKIIIKVYYEGELGSEEEVLTQLQFGGIALGRVNVLAVSEQVPSFITSFSKLIGNSFDSFLDYIENNDNYNFAFQNEKLCPLTILPPSKRCIYSDENIDFNNYSQIRVGIDNSQMYQNFLQRWDINPIFIGNIATFPSLRNGFIDAKEFTLSSFVNCDEYPYIQEVAILDHVTLPSIILFSNEVLNQLSRDEVKILEECAIKTLEYSKNYIAREEYLAIEQVARDKNMRRF